MITKDYTITDEGKKLYYEMVSMMTAASDFYRRSDPKEVLSAVILGRKEYELLCPVLWERDGYMTNDMTPGFPEEFHGVPLVVVEESCIRMIPKPRLTSLFGLPSLDNFSPRS